jgi:hypothetical protein
MNGCWYMPWNAWPLLLLLLLGLFIYSLFTGHPWEFWGRLLGGGK